jgi:predicted DNA-binding protein
MSRPHIGQRVTFRCPAELLYRIMDEAASSGRTTPETIRDLLEHALTDKDR